MSGTGGTPVATGGAPASSGGTGAATGGVTAVGGATGSGGTLTLLPVDCSPIAAAGHEVCSTTETTCAAVFTDGAGCAAVCAEAGLDCMETWENADGACAPDTSLTELSCEPASGHQSDYCLCVGEGSPAGTGGSGGVGGTGTGGTNTGGSGSGGSASGGSGGIVLGDAPCDVPSYIFSETTPIGWANQSGGTTGGGSTTPVLVTSLSQFQDLVESDTAKVLYIQGTFAPADISIGSNTTIVGCSSGAHLQGHIGIGSGTSNVIVRNLNISGYAVGNCALDPDFDSGKGCSSGNDAVGINGDAHHVWFDHCSVKDGTDGNLDITNDADFVTVSWTKFSYTPRTDSVGNDSTGAAGHRFSNLVGGTDSEPTGWPDTIPLNVTWHHNWWADGVVERQPRVRYGRNHIFNNYYNSTATNYCVRAGIEAKVLIQGNYFDGVDSPHQFNGDDDATAFISVGSGGQANTYANTSGDQSVEGDGTEWTNSGTNADYAYTVEPASGVPAAVMTGAGPH
jgi:pectate lyase